jgi:hypothetical protein
MSSCTWFKQEMRSGQVRQPYHVVHIDGRKWVQNCGDLESRDGQNQGIGDPSLGLADALA